MKNESPTINGDGGQTRDFTFVENAVQANVKSFFAEEKAINTVYNIAYGDRISLNLLWEQLNSFVNEKVIANYGPDRIGDIRDSLADISKAKSNIKYNPLFSVYDGLEITYNWFKANK